MTWALLDDHANEHPKLLAAGAEAAWLWACGLMYCRRQRGGRGFIPEAMVPMLFPLKSPRKLAGRLVEVGLWNAAEGGYLVHEYAEWCDQGRRSAESEGRGKRRNRDGDPPRRPDIVRTESGQGTNDVSGQNPDLPDPYRSDPIRSDPVGNVVVDLSGRGDLRPELDDDRDTPCPANLEERIPSEAIAEMATGHGVPEAAVRKALSEFVAYWTIGGGAGKRRKSWPRLFRQRVHELARQGLLASGAPVSSGRQRASPRSSHVHDPSPSEVEYLRKIGVPA